MQYTLLFHFMSHDFFIENWASLLICGYSRNHIPPTLAIFTKNCLSVWSEPILYSLSRVASNVCLVTSVVSWWLDRDFLKYNESIILPVFSKGICVHVWTQMLWQFTLCLNFHFLITQSYQWELRTFLRLSSVLTQSWIQSFLSAALHINDLLFQENVRTFKSPIGSIQFSR